MLRILHYPFKSKPNFTTAPREPNVPDHKLKIAKKLAKLDYSNEPGCWEIDLMFVENQIYFVMINVNTRYLIVEPIPNREAGTLSRALCNILIHNNELEVNTIKVDGEKGFRFMDDIVIVYYNDGYYQYVSGLITDCKPKQLYDTIMNTHNIRAFKQFLNKTYNDVNVDAIEDYSKLDINVIVDSGKFTLAHKIVDSVIRTLRNAFGEDTRRMADYSQMRQMVDYYNNTPHKSLRLRNYEGYWYSSVLGECSQLDSEEYKGSGLMKPNKYIYLTPYQMQSNPDIEWQYIRMMKSRMQEIKEKQRLKGLLSYRKGNIILIHLDYGKTKQRFDKRRRVFNKIAEFMAYSNGNVVCRVMGQASGIVTVPIMYTKFIANNYDELDDSYKAYFSI